MDSMQVLRFTLPANGERRFEIGGRYLEIVACPLSINVDFTQASGQQQGNRWGGALAGFYSEGEFSGLTITNPHAVDQAIVLILTDGRAGYRGIPNILNATIDGAAISVLGRRFSGQCPGPSSATQAAIIYSQTGAAVAVHSITLWPTVAGANAQITTGTGRGAATVAGTGLGDPPNGEGVPFMAGGALASAARMQLFNVTGSIGAGTITNEWPLARLGVLNGASHVYRPNVPFIVQGTNVVAVRAPAGSFANVSVELEEL